MYLAAAQAVKGADNHTLYFAVAVALAYQGQFFAFAVLVAAPYFPVYQANYKAVCSAVSASIGFLLV
jgi:hypothetical protein